MAVKDKRRRAEIEAPYCRFKGELNLYKVKSSSAIALLIACTVAGCGCKHSQPEKPLPTIYIIEGGRTGWVKIYYNRHEERPLPVENGFAIARVGPDMKLYTRSAMNPAWDGSQFYSQNSDGKRARLVSTEGDSCVIWGQDKTSDDTGDHEDFFVGTEQDFAMNLKLPKNSGTGFPETPVDTREPGFSSQSPAMNRVLTDLPKQ